MASAYRKKSLGKRNQHISYGSKKPDVLSVIAQDYGYCQRNQNVESYGVAKQPITGAGRNDSGRGCIVCPKPPAQEVSVMRRTVNLYIGTFLFVCGIQCLPDHYSAASQPVFNDIPFHVKRTYLVEREPAAVACNQSAFEEKLFFAHTYIHIEVLQENLSHPQNQYY